MRTAPATSRHRPAVALPAVVALVAGLLTVQTLAAAHARAASYPVSAAVTVPTTAAQPRTFDSDTEAANCSDADGGSVRPVRSLTLYRATGDLPEFPVVDVGWRCAYPAGAPVSTPLAPLDESLVPDPGPDTALGTATCPAAVPVLVGLDTRFTTGGTTPEGYTGDALDDVRPVCGALGTDGRSYGATVEDWLSGDTAFDATDSLRCDPGAFVQGFQGGSDAAYTATPHVYALGIECTTPDFDPAVVAATFPQTDPTVAGTLGADGDGDPADAACGRGVVATGVRLSVLDGEGSARQLDSLGLDCAPLTSPTAPTALVGPSSRSVVVVPPDGRANQIAACPAGTALTGLRVTDNETVGSQPLLGAFSGYCSTLDPGGTTSIDGEPDVTPQVGIAGGALIGIVNCPSDQVITGLSVGSTETGYGVSPVGVVVSCSALTLGVVQQPANSSWTTATLVGANSVTRQALTSPGAALWFKFPVQPGSTVGVDLTDLPADDDLAVFGDIGQSFLSLTDTDAITRLSAEFAGVDVAPTTFSPTTFSPTTFSPTTFSPTTFSPTTFSPTTFSPTTFSPTTFSPTTFSPTTFSPTTFSPTTFSPEVTPDQYLQAGSFDDLSALAGAFSAAQTRSLLAVSAHAGLAPESYNAPTWNRQGFSYVRVTARDGATSPVAPTLRVSTTGGPCDIPLDTFDTTPTLAGSADGARTVVVTDTGRFGAGADLSALDAANSALASAGSDGGSLAAIGPVAVVDVADSARVQALEAQADAHPGCAYAKNLVAQAIRDIVNSYRGPSKTLAYVVVEGSDAVVPFFRYADRADVAPESGFAPPVADGSTSDASLRGDFVLGQDAYGAAYDLTLGGLPMPVPDVAVGRLVEAPAEIAATVSAYVAGRGAAIDPTSTLSTGYDFLAAGAKQVASSFAAADAGGRNDTLITDQGVDRSLTTVGGTPTPDRTWTAADLRASLLGTRHDVVYLAGHFSASASLAADFSSVVTTQDLASAPAGNFRNTLVFSAGCHSGYNLVDSDGVPGVTDPLDWAQAFAQQGATLVAGTGYQYGDTDFVKYSNQLYVGFAEALRRGTGAVAVGSALVQAKRDYLAGQPALDGVDQKSLLEATVFGLPMQGVDFPTGRTAAPQQPSPVAAGPVSGQPATTFGLVRSDLTVTPSLTTNSVPLASTGGGTVTATYLSGPGGAVKVTPAAPALPVVRENATAPTGTVLRGVGFRSGSYTDTPGITPLTGAPATETNTVHGPFVSDVQYPTTLATPNYFDALGGGGATGATSLFVTPAQYRSDAPGSLTTVQRQFAQLGFSLYYSGPYTTTGGNQPTAAAPPSMTGTVATSASGGTVVRFSTHVVGDPSAGISSVWATWTVPPTGGGTGQWQSLDLTQDSTDSTLWTGSVRLPAGVTASGLQFLVQAVNGVGVVGVDDALGAYHRVGSTPVRPAATLTLSSVPAQVTAGGSIPVTARLTTASGAALKNRAVTVSGGGGSQLATTDSAGRVRVSLPATAPGTADVTASWRGDTSSGAATSAPVHVTVTQRPTSLLVTTTSTGYSLALRDVTTAGHPIGVPAVTVFLVATDRAGGVLAVRPVLLDALGRGAVPVASVPAGTRRVSAWFGSPVTPNANGGTFSQTDPLYAPAAATTLDLQPQRIALTPAARSVGAGTPVDYTVTATYGATSTAVTSQAALTITSANGRPAAGASCSGGSCSATRAGDYLVTAHYVGRVATATLTVAAGAFSALVVTPAQSTVTAGVVRRFTVRATDAYGNPVSSAPPTVTIVPLVGGSTVGASCTAAGCDARTAGQYRVVATVGDITGSTVLTVVAGAAASTIAVGGDGQSARVGDAFAAPLVAYVQDAYGNPVAGRPVTFTVAAADASSGAATFPGGTITAVVPSGADGRAVAPVLTGTSAGPVTVTAAAAGVADPAVYQVAVTSSDTSRADLAVAVAMTTNADGTLTARVTVRNQGPDPAVRTVAKLALTGPVVVTDAGGGRLVTKRQVRFATGTVAVGASVTYTVVLRRIASDRPVLAVASALAATSDPDTSDNTASAVVPAG